MRVLFAGGGTGGHIYPALAVAEAVKRQDPNAAFLFIAGTRGVEQRIYRNAGYEVETVTVTGMPRRPSFGFVTFIIRLGESTWKAAGVIRRFRPAVTVATGGYVAGPPIIASGMAGVPVAIQEQNSFPGITSRYLARFADIAFLGFPEAAYRLPGVRETLVTGNPVRRGITGGNRAAAAVTFGLDPGRAVVLIIGGSQGARAVNRAVGGVLDAVIATGAQVLWQTGEGEFETWRDRDGMGNGAVRVLPYLDDMADAYALADAAVARAGAMTLAELTACGVPAVLVPLPTAAANHQEANARSLVDAGAARMILERDLTPETLAASVTAIIGDADTRKTMSDAARELGRPEAADTIACELIARYSAA